MKHLNALKLSLSSVLFGVLSTLAVSGCTEAGSSVAKASRVQAGVSPGSSNENPSSRQASRASSVATGSLQAAISVSQKPFSQLVPGASELLGSMIVEDPRKGAPSSSYAIQSKDFLGSVVDRIEGEPARSYNSNDVHAALGILGLTAAIDQLAGGVYNKFESVPRYRLTHVIRRFVADNATDPSDRLDQEGLYQKVLKKWREGCDSRSEDVRGKPCAFIYTFNECDWQNAIPDFNKPANKKEIADFRQTNDELYVRAVYGQSLNDLIPRIKKDRSMKFACETYFVAAPDESDASIRKRLIQLIVELQYRKKYVDTSLGVFQVSDSNEEIRKHPWGEISFEVSEDRLPKTWDGFKNLLQERLEFEYQRRTRSSILAGLLSHQMGSLSQDGAYANGPWVQKFLAGQKMRERSAQFGVFRVSTAGKTPAEIQSVFAEIKKAGSESIGPTHSDSVVQLQALLSRLQAQGIQVSPMPDAQDGSYVREFSGQFTPLFKSFTGTDLERLMYTKLFRREKTGNFKEEPTGEEHGAYASTFGKDQVEEVFALLLSESVATNAPLNSRDARFDREEIQSRANQYYSLEQSKEVFKSQLKRVHLMISHGDSSFKDIRGKSDLEAQRLMIDGVMKRYEELKTALYESSGYSETGAAQQAWEIITNRAVESPLRTAKP